MTLAQLLHEAHTQLTPEHQHALRTLMQREADFAHALGAVAACATACACCELHRRIVRQVLDKHDVPWGFATLRDLVEAGT